MIALLAATAALPVTAADWFVDGAGGNDNQVGTRNAPLLSVWRAWTLAQPGDTINLLPTTLYGPIYLARKSGEPGKFITLRGAGSAANPTRVSGMGRNFGIMLDTNTNYVRIANLDITAPGAGRVAGWSGIYIKNSHHVSVLNNRVHDAGCSGVQTHGADYVSITRNVVYSNAKNTTNYIYCSGISLYQDRDVDANTGIKMVVARNIVFSNTNVPMPDCGTRCRSSDGNGIIIDDARRTQSDRIAYKGAHLIENNVIYGNGGKGVHLFQSDNVIVRSNTLFENNQDPFHRYRNSGEINVNNSAGIDIYGNIAVSGAKDMGSGLPVPISVQHTQPGGKPVRVDYNLTFNILNDASSTIHAANNAVDVYIGNNNRWGNPLFLRASLDPALADFRVGSTSPALRFPGNAAFFASRDFQGVNRYTLDHSRNWARIANEGTAFAVGGTRTVRYGSGRNWTEKIVNDIGQCSDAYFGKDPLRGVRKECQIAIAAPLKTPTGTWSLIAEEGERFSVAGTQTVRYGSGNSWTQKRAGGTFQCTNAYFGRDSRLGTRSRCELLVGPAAPLAAGRWAKIANEGSAFTVIGSQTVRFGGGSRWTEKSIVDGGSCTSAFYGKDPYNGVYKQCDLFSATALPTVFGLQLFGEPGEPVITAGAHQLPY